MHQHWTKSWIFPMCSTAAQMICPTPSYQVQDRAEFSQMTKFDKTITSTTVCRAHRKSIIRPV